MFAPSAIASIIIAHNITTYNINQQMTIFLKKYCPIINIYSKMKRMPAEYKDRATGEIQPHLILPTRERAGFLGIKNNIIPVFFLRVPEQHYQIAQATNSKKPVAFEAPGVFGILLA